MRPTVLWKLHFAVGDCCDLAFEDRTFDIVVTMNTIYFWNDTLNGLQEIYRVLKDGGVFYNAVLTKENLDKLFYTKNGFKKWEGVDGFIISPFHCVGFFRTITPKKVMGFIVKIGKLHTSKFAF